ncbi:MAG TPA: GntR family transcriptional regulator, partial [Alphaproteobacteria bacterium]
MRTDTTLARLRQIVKDASRAGERLPPERVLSARLGVSRGTLRRALEVLEAEGKIWRHVGRGTFAGARPPVVEADGAVTRFTNPAEVMEVRRIVEPSMAALAAIRASANDISVMENCLRKGEAATTTSAFEMWDGMLHRTIATAARNTLLLSLFNAVNAVRGDQVWGQLKDASLTRQ